MPRTAVLDTNGADNSEVKRRVRPVRERTFDYDLGKLTFQNEVDFWRFLRGYPNKSGCSLHVYRLHPVIDNGLIGRDESSIEITADLENYGRTQIEASHGGGVYMLKLTDANASPRERAKSYVKIDDPDIEPILDIRTLKLLNPKNTEYVERLIAKGVLIRDANGTPQLKTEAHQTAVPPAPVAPVVVSVSGGVPPASTSVMGGMEVVPAGVWGKLIGALVDRVLIPPAPPAPAVSPESIVTLGLSLAEKFREVPPAPAPDPGLDILANYERVRRIVAPIAAVAPVPIAEGASGWSAFFASLPSILQVLPSVAAGFAAAQAQRAAVGGPRPVYVAGPGPGFAPGYSQPVNPPAPVPPAADELSMFSPMVREKIERLLPMAVDRFLDGTSGNDFAVAVEHLEGASVLRALEALPIDAVYASMSGIAFAHPPLAARLAADPQSLRNWLNDFFGVEDEIEVGAA